MLEFSEILAARVKAARGVMSLRDFSKLCGISHTHLDSIEKGFDPRTGKPVSVRWETLTKLSKGTGYSVNYLVGDTNNPYAGTIINKDGSRIENPLNKEDSETYSDAMLQKKEAPSVESTEEALKIIAHNAFGPNPTQEQINSLDLAVRIAIEQARDKRK